MVSALIDDDIDEARVTVSPCAVRVANTILGYDPDLGPCLTLLAELDLWFLDNAELTTDRWQHN
jgi:hypothetical protein